MRRADCLYSYMKSLLRPDDLSLLGLVLLSTTSGGPRVSARVFVNDF